MITEEIKQHIIEVGLDPDHMPSHIAVIMDGNGRWAKEQGKARVFGHKNGVKAVRQVTEGCAELGIDYLTLYAFSTENWGRSSLEVNALMHLLVDTLKKEIDTLKKNNIRLRAIGDLNGLPKRTHKALLSGIADTEHFQHMQLVLALNYSARWDLTQAIQQIAAAAVDGTISTEAIDEQLIHSFMSTSDLPDPDLIIRSSGEQRLSNFLLWEGAYSEFYFTPTMWPDFDKSALNEAIKEYQGRQRRFGR